MIYSQSANINEIRAQPNEQWMHKCIFDAIKSIISMLLSHVIVNVLYNIEQLRIKCSQVSIRPDISVTIYQKKCYTWSDIIQQNVTRITLGSCWHIPLMLPCSTVADGRQQ